jgi:23S rRNA (cytidine1920-2'-O)/16S rRNA (cytidine1409-2'-O)-methyltransferase
MEERLDKILLQRRLVESRKMAEQIIQEIGVKVNGKLVAKPGKKFSPDCSIEMIDKEKSGSSKEAVKLLEAIQHWSLVIENASFLEVGSTLGSFSEVLLAKKAKKVYALHVSKEAISQKLKTEQRLVDCSGMQLRELTKNKLTELLDGCVIDDPFLSVDKIFPFIHPFLKDDAFVIAVIKPQFEVNKEQLKNNGTVRNSLAFPEMMENVKMIGSKSNLEFVDSIESPIIGKGGHHEFIFFFKKRY